MRDLKLSTDEENLRFNGCPYRFSIGDSPPYTRSIVIGIRNLPLHMWTPAIIEQVLSPYCGLEYINQETRTMDDLSNFTCICQRTVPIPDEIAIKVPKNKTATSLFLNKYTISIEKNQYLHGVTRRCIYSVPS
jgi:hypothetical protein